MNVDPPLEPADIEHMEAVIATIGSLERIFKGDDGTPAALHMAAAALRDAAGVFDEIAERWAAALQSEA